MPNFINNTNLHTSKLVSLLLIVFILQGCAAAAVVAITAGASMATDPRSIGNQIDDQGIELEAHNEIVKNKTLSEKTNLNITSVNGAVLIIGQAPTINLRDQAIKIVHNLNGVVKVHNQIRIRNITSVGTQTNDVWLTSKIKTALFSSGKVNAKNIKVVTENGEVFLMGIVPKREADIAVNITRNINGVKKVFKGFEYL